MNSTRALFSLTLIAAMVACSGGGGGSSGSVPASATTTTGTISGFGSIVINGVHYETDNTAVSYDDSSRPVSALSAGQLVTISGSTDGDGRHHAGSVAYDSAVVGPVSSVSVDTGSFVALGQTVLVSATTVYANATGLGELGSGSMVRVSGNRDASGNVVAGYVELLASAPASYRLSGTVSGISGSQFSIGAETIDASAAQLRPDGATLSNGLSVVVVGTLDSNDSSGATLLASKVRVRKALDGAEHGSGAELEGIITSASASDASSGSFSIGDTVIHYDASTTLSQHHGSASTAALIAGSRVEVHGTLNADGSLQALRIEVEATASAGSSQQGYLLGVLSANPDTGASSIQLLGATVLIDGSTVFIDRSAEANPMFSLADLASGSLVQVALSEQGNTLTALKVERPGRTPPYRAAGGPFAAVNAEAHTLSVSTVPVLAQNDCSVRASSQGPGGGQGGSQGGDPGQHHGGPDDASRVALNASCTLYFLRGQLSTQAEYFSALADPQNANASVMALGNDGEAGLTATLLDLQLKSQSGDLSQEAD